MNVVALIARCASVRVWNGSWGKQSREEFVTAKLPH